MSRKVKNSRVSELKLERVTFIQKVTEREFEYDSFFIFQL